MKFDLEKDKLLILLVVADIAFVILHLLYVYSDVFSSSLYSLSRDQGYAEFFQYTKELWILLLFLILAVRLRRGIYLVFSVLFLYFLIDDAFEFHENFGRFLSDFLNFQSVGGLRPMDWGELLVSGIFGLLFAIALAIFYLLSEPQVRRVARYLIGMIAVLAGFGVALDMLEIMVNHPDLEQVLVIIEEAGEMLVMSVIAWFVFRLNLYTGLSPLSEPHPKKIL